MVFFFYVFSLEFDFIVLKTSLMTCVSASRSVVGEVKEAPCGTRKGWVWPAQGKQGAVGFHFLLCISEQRTPCFQCEAQAKQQKPARAAVEWMKGC